ncbi:uncharacterized protein LOC131153971 [Malania oleifera]|uniref:uncharacterized protein LOC131153971 n=1 Tax=Malania oleifera TaxID=397392 RepID=UPI0025AE81F2|nr:uncharacterized protein LOC131153971 [Malania oleifera]
MGMLLALLGQIPSFSSFPYLFPSSPLDPPSFPDLFPSSPPDPPLSIVAPAPRHFCSSQPLAHRHLQTIAAPRPLPFAKPLAHRRCRRYRSLSPSISMPNDSHKELQNTNAIIGKELKLCHSGTAEYK